ncbi:hypothetical protein SCHPADRAFT_888176 [Schizopora paradoxa]|uniref:Uncharacterized protein n=1 Tax=Schizopora paradoxa TaxID=27342 RepID=A0A0H2S243_9AGAM|nr:hypothetical protein SCHPADRAFT_888176 [Schizopora paradoxa]
MVSEHGPDEFEKRVYYNGITGTGDADHPALVYRSNALTTPFPKPTGRFAHIPVKSARGVFDTPLNKVWDVVGPKICYIIKTREVHWTSIDAVRFFTHGAPGEDEEGTLGPVVVWIGVKPGSTSPDTAHELSQDILALRTLWWNGERRTDPTRHARRFLAGPLAVPLSTKEAGGNESEGTLTLRMHKNKYRSGELSDNVFGITNHHVLRKGTETDFELKDGEAKDLVRVCGMRRFQRGLDEIKKAVADNRADLRRSEIAKRRAEGDQLKNAKKIIRMQNQLDEMNEAIVELEKLYADTTKYWSDIELHRNIGHVVYAPAIKVDQGRTNYTADWGAFLAEKPKVKDGFVGNVVDLGSKYSPLTLMDMFYPGSKPSIPNYPEEQMLRVSGCTTKEELDVPTEFDSEGQRCLIVGKDGNTTDLAIGRFSGLESFINHTNGVESKELAIYNSGNKVVEVFSAKGDSGSLVWHMKDGTARIVGQLHSGGNKGGLTSNHVSYCTPGWYLLEEIKKKYKYADFYRTTW